MAATDKTLRIRFEITGNGEVKVKELDNKVKELNLTMKQAETVAKKYNTTVKNLTSKTFKTSSVEFQQMAGQMGNLSTKTGAASSAALELGRVISDAPYGIRGVANNLSQLASMMMFSASAIDKTTKKAIGFSGALKGLFQALKGPLGILLAIQLVIAIFEKLSMSTDKVQKKLDEFGSKSITNSVAKLVFLKNALNDTNVEMRDKVSLLNKASGEFKELNGYVKDGTVDILSFNKSVDLMIDKMKEIAFAKAILQAATENMQEFVKTIAKGPEGAFSSFKSFAAATLDAFTGNSNATMSIHSENIIEMEQQTNRMFDMLKATKKDGKGGIIGEVLFGKKSNGEELPKRLKKQLLNLSKEILTFNREQSLILEENEINKLDITQKYEKEDLERKKTSFIDKQKLRLEEFKASNASDKDKLKAQATFYEMELDAKNKHQIALTSLTIKQQKERQKLERDLKREHLKLLRNEKDSNIVLQLKTEEMETLNMLSRLAIQKEVLDIKLQQDINRINRNINERKREGKQYEDLEFKKSNVIETHNQNTIKNDNLVAENKLKVLEYVGSAMTAFTALAGRETEAGKALAIATATIDTYVGANKALTDETIPNTFARIAAVAAVIATGIANVKSIASTKVGDRGTSQSVSGPQVREFDFNLVGSTGVNQLAEGIGGQFGQPIQAYVVSSQISSQQQLDGIIQSNATIGD